MKKVLTILICLLLVFCVNVEAAKKKTKKKSTTKNVVTNTLPAVVDGKDPIKVYVFTKESCPYCEKAKSYLNSIKAEYGKYYEVVIYQIYDANWNVENAKYEKLKDKVAAAHNEKISGVPYIVIGENFTVNEWRDDVTGETIKEQILREYVNENYKDIVAPLLAEVEAEPDPHANDLIIIIALGVLVVGTIGAVVYFGRKRED